MASSDRPGSGTLPAQLTSFVGRRHEVAEVKRLLPAVRLVTVTGVGGVGKTRLALSVARQLRRAFPGGVWLVELDRLRDQSLLAQTVAGTLGLVEQPGRPPADVLAEYLPGRRVLLLLDNCEHLVDAVAKLADRLLRSASDLRVLATSREPLGIGAETVVELPPLRTPDPDRPVDRAELLRSEAVALFTERAAAVTPDFEVTEDNQAAVVRICHLVEGLPLAVELAATWLRVLSPEQIRDRLTDRLALLTRGSRVMPDRQRTLRGCIDWSYELCTRAERRMWARLSVFAGGFDADSVARVCDGEQVAPDYLGEVLESLRRKSILIREESADRYRMLETLREYGAGRLAGEPDHGRIARRHRDHYAAMAARAEAAWTGPEQLSWARTLTREHANLQLALEYCLREPDQAGAAQELAARLWFFWIACGFLREGRYYLDRAVRLGGAGRPRRWALWACAFVTGSMNDLGIAEELARQCRAEAAEAGDRRLTICATEVRGMIHAIRGDLDPAVDLLRECQDYYGGLDRIDVGRLRTLPMLGVTLVMRGDLDAALALEPECRRLCESLGEQWQRSYVHHFVALALRGKNDPAGAVRNLTTAIATKHQFHDIIGLIMCLEPLAGAHADLGDGERAARLLGAAENLRHCYGLQAFGSAFHSGEYQQVERRARELLGAEEYDSAVGKGRGMDLDGLVAYAVAERRPPDSRDLLTRREGEVAELVGDGLTNAEIAARLVVSPRTAESHVQNAMTKLGFTHRAQLAAWITARRPQES